MIACSRCHQPIRTQGEGRGWGNGPMYFFLCVTCLVLLLRRMCHVYAKERGLAAHTGLSITRHVRGGDLRNVYPSAINSAGFTERQLKTRLYGTKNRSIP